MKLVAATLLIAALQVAYWSDAATGVTRHSNPLQDNIQVIFEGTVAFSNKSVNALRVGPAERTTGPKYPLRVVWDPRLRRVTVYLARGDGDRSRYMSAVPRDTPPTPETRIVVVLSDLDAEFTRVTTYVSCRSLGTHLTDMPVRDLLPDDVIMDGPLKLVTGDNDLGPDGQCTSADTGPRGEITSLLLKNVSESKMGYTNKDYMQEDESEPAAQTASSSCSEMAGLLRELTTDIRSLRAELRSQKSESEELRRRISSCNVCRDTCATNPCFRSVTCTNTDTGYQCGDCPPGFTGNGIDCVAIMTCRSHPCFTGVRCTTTANGRVCGDCPAGYTGDGTRCNRIRIGCDPSPCSRGERCVETRTGHECVRCPDGYTGNGIRCEPIRIGCSPNPCPRGERCVETRTGHECVKCPPGQSWDGNTCERDDPCEDFCYPRVTCTVQRGSPRCEQCPSGMTGSGRKGDCQWMTCDDGYCFRGSTCHPGRPPRCSACPAGYTGNGTRYGCTPLSCSSDYCDERARCTERDNLPPICTCPPPMIGDGRRCRIPRCSDYCDRLSQMDQCRERQGQAPICGRCREGFRGSGRRGDCRPIPCREYCDEHAQCVDNAPNAPQCIRCQTPYIGDGSRGSCRLPRCSDRFCDSRMKCVDHPNRVPECRFPSCSDDYCDERVNCTDVPQGFPRCHGCPPGLTGDGRRGTCRPVTCDDSPCFPRVTCTMTAGRATCGPCPPGRTGSGRADDCPIVTCSQNRPCAPGVECRDYPSGARCICPAGHVSDGTRYGCRPVQCADLRCETGCRNLASGPQCVCREGTVPDGSGNCRRKTCDDITCYAGCRELQTGPRCNDCPAGMTADRLPGSCRWLRCSDDYCYPGVTCTDNNNRPPRCGDCPGNMVGNGTRYGCRGVTCAELTCYAGCRELPSGPRCNPCPAGMIRDGTPGGCRWMMCSDGYCFSRVTCQNRRGAPPICGQCPIGYVGSGLRDDCRAVDCRDDPCFPRVICTNLARGYVCGDCPPGYGGDGQNCTRTVVRCSARPSPCSSLVTCTNLQNGVQCGRCPAGYTGDGHSCVDIDECALVAPCDSLTTCINLSPGFRCTSCPRGYTSPVVRGVGLQYARTNRQICADVDECLVSNGGCVAHSVCINTRGSYRCGQCDYGYTGNQQQGCISMIGLCLDGRTVCNEHATCYLPQYTFTYRCRCNFGYAGNGFYCGADYDLDGWSDIDLGCSDRGCRADNCRTMPNSGQEDTNDNGIGDVCEDDPDGDGLVVPTDNCPFVYNPNQENSDNDDFGNACDNCPLIDSSNLFDFDGDGQGDICDLDIDNDRIVNSLDNCPYIPNRDQRDGDNDGVGDVCDNCPHLSNSDQRDRNGDRWGDACSGIHDRDRDGWWDEIDNCPDIPNACQCDNDGDELGDACDDDDDNDRIYDVRDNCPYIYNPDQSDEDNNGIGDACEGDHDGDKESDIDDVCPANGKISRVDFRSFQTVSLDPEGENQAEARWIVHDEGRELLQTYNSDPGLAVGYDYFEGVDFSGTVYVGVDSDLDFVGFVFSYQNNANFYTVMWKGNDEAFTVDKPFHAHSAEGIFVKAVQSETGPGNMLRNSLWNTGGKSNQVKTIWEHEDNVGWKPFTAYRWELYHRPAYGLIRILMFDQNGLIADSGNIVDATHRGGRLGVLCFSQDQVYFSNLMYRCNEDIPASFGFRGNKLD